MCRVDLQEALASVLDKRRKRSQQLHTSVRAHVQVSFDDFVKRMMGEQKQVEDHGYVTSTAVSICFPT